VGDDALTLDVVAEVLADPVRPSDLDRGRAGEVARADAGYVTPAAAGRRRRGAHKG
jgi:hypothetical protein